MCLRCRPRSASTPAGRPKVATRAPAAAPVRVRKLRREVGVSSIVLLPDPATRPAEPLPRTERSYQPRRHTQQRLRRPSFACDVSSRRPSHREGPVSMGGKQMYVITYRAMAVTVTEERGGSLVEAPTVGVRIRALRGAMGLSLRGLADPRGGSAPMLSPGERGGASPTLAVAAPIASRVGLT